MAIITENVINLRKTLDASVFIEDFLRKHILPKLTDRNLDMSKLDPYAVQVSILCPFHNETQPSFRLYRKHSLDHFDDWYCFGSCRTGGGIVELYKHTQLTFYNRAISQIQAMIELAEMYYIHHPPLYFEDVDANQYLEIKGITEEDILDNLNESKKLIVEPMKHYGVYLTLIERALSIIKPLSLEDYKRNALELDYIFSLGLEKDELSIELESLNRVVTSVAEHITEEEET